MKITQIAGVALVIIGLIAAGFAMSSGEPSTAAAAVEAASAEIGTTFQDVILPIFSGISIALGLVLLGTSLGNWRHPRTHLEPGDEVVNPEGYHKMKHV